MFKNILQKWGYKKLNKCLENKNIFTTISIDKVSILANILSFIIGFILTLVTALIDISYISNSSLINIDPSTLLSIIITNVIIISFEFYLLFIVGFQATARYINEITPNRLFITDDIRNSLVRAVLELDEPNIITHDLNPHKIKEKSYWFIVIIYKTKVIFSNIFAKIILKKLIGRGGTRAYIPLISTVVTGFWDSWVQHKILKKIRYRLESRIYIINLMQSLQEPIHRQQYIETVIRLISIRLELYGYYNVNLSFILNEVEIAYPLSVTKCIKPSDITLMYKSFEKLTSNEKNNVIEITGNLLAFKQNSLSKEEKQLLTFFDIDTAKLNSIKNKFNTLESTKLTRRSKGLFDSAFRIVY